MENTREITLRLLVPLLYACFLAPVLVGILSAIILIEHRWHLHVLFRMGDLDGVAVLLLWGSPLFWLGSAWMNWLSQPGRSVWRAHLHQNSLVYLLAVFSLLSLILTYPSAYGGLAYGMVVGFFLTCLWAVCINAVFLLWRRQGKKMKYT
jgi:hypothetical protein